MRFPLPGKSSLPPLEVVMNEAVTLYHQGRPVEAETLLLRRLDTIKQQNGTDNPIYTQTLIGYASLMNLLGKRDQALNALAAACEYEPPATDTDAVKARLTYLMEYGEALSTSGRLEEAEKVLRTGVQGRLALYGQDHAGYTFGLEPLAINLLHQGNIAEASTMQEEVVANFKANRHPRLLNALILLAVVRQMTGSAENPLDDLTRLSPAAAEQMAKDVAPLLDTFPNRARQPVLLNVAALAASILGDDHQAVLNLLAKIVNNETEAGDQADHTVRLKVAKMLFASYERQQRYEEAGHALLGLAFAQGQAGDPVSAGQSYERARRGSEHMGNFILASQAERNHGLMLADMKRPNDAELRLRNALALAERAADIESRGEAECALGIFLQHAERYDAAKPLLESALTHLTSTHPNAIYTLSHYMALEKGVSCGCNDSHL